jgi:hypothetical protein
MPMSVPRLPRNRTTLTYCGRPKRHGARTQLVVLLALARLLFQYRLRRSQSRDRHSEW